MHRLATPPGPDRAHEHHCFPAAFEKATQLRRDAERLRPGRLVTEQLDDLQIGIDDALDESMMHQMSRLAWC